MQDFIRVEIEGYHDENYCIIDCERAEVWGHNHSSHGYCVYMPQLIRVITKSEALALAGDMIKNKE